MQGWGGDLDRGSRVHCHVTGNDELVCLRELPEHNSTVASLSVAEVLAKLDQSLEVVELAIAQLCAGDSQVAKQEVRLLPKD